MSKSSYKLVMSKIPFLVFPTKIPLSVVGQPFLVLSIIASFSKLLELFISFDAVRRCAVYTGKKKYNELIYIVKML